MIVKLNFDHLDWFRRWRTVAARKWKWETSPVNTVLFIILRYNIYQYVTKHLLFITIQLFWFLVPVYAMLILKGIWWKLTYRFIYFIIKYIYICMLNNKYINWINSLQCPLCVMNNYLQIKHQPNNMQLLAST